MFPRSWRLTRSKDVQNVYRKGRGASTHFLMIRGLAARQIQPRFAVVISKKIAKRAVVRNRLKRLVRQSIQELMAMPKMVEQFNKNDFVITVHRDPQEPYTLDKVKPEVTRCFARLLSP